MIRLMLAAVALVFSVAPAAATAAPPLDGITVTIGPTGSSVVLGENLDLTITVTNDSNEPTARLIAHLDITDPASATSVDPEDWTSTLSKPIGVVEPGADATVEWNIQPISPGMFVVYAVAITPEASNVVASNVLTVTVDDQRSLDPGGILPLAIGAPVVIGALLLIRIRTKRRTGDVVKGDGSTS